MSSQIAIQRTNRLPSELSPLEKLPTTVLGVVLAQLSAITGTQGIVNEADIPVIMRNIHSLSCTSRAMYHAVSDPIATEMLLRSLSKKFPHKIEYFAAKLNTLATRRWIWQYINKNGYDEAYNTIQEVYDLAAHVSAESQKAGLGFRLGEGRKGWPSPNPFYSQTRTGFLLHAGTAPHSMATPFGKITIYGGGIGNDSLSVLEVFIKRLNATFEGVTFGFVETPSERDVNYKIIVPDLENDQIRKIDSNKKVRVTKQQLAGEKGSQNIVFNSYCGNDSVYRIRRVGNRVMPEISWHSRESTLESEVVQTMWEMLEKARAGKDPVTKEIVHRSIRKEPSVIKRTYTLAELSERAIDLVRQLAEQPLFPEKRWISAPSKVLPLENYRTAHSVELLNKAANVFLEENHHWNIHRFGGNNGISLRGKDLGEGLDLRLYEGSNQGCDLNTLKSAYDHVLSNIGLNWKGANLKDYPNILHTESEEDYVLLIKNERTFSEEEVLLRCTISDLGLSKHAIACANWKNQPLSDRSLKPLYLWIRKSKLQEVSQLLNLR